MATATPSRSPLDRAASNRRVDHPLHQLRNTIRLYVLAEGLGVLLLFLVLCFWIGLLLDFGFFKGFWITSILDFDFLRFSVDWVQVLPWGVRAALLGVVSAGLLGVVLSKVFLRLFRDFRPSALALVLERRFPDLLGERLITAVELADPKLAEQYGFSQPMVDQTIQEAAARVDQVAINEVFDWRRLRNLGIALAVLTIGTYLLVLGAYAALTGGVGGFFGRFNDVASVWFERDVLLMDTIWPRRAHLELIDFPGTETRIGRDAPPPTLRVRALKWVIADPAAPEGWRALTWADLNPELLGAQVPSLTLPTAWANWNMDKIELQLEKPEVVGALSGADTVPGLRRLFEGLHERAASPRMSRRLRELVIPGNVEIYFKGASTRSQQTMTPGVDHEYAAAVSNLKESLRFTVRGEDYYTAPRWIIVVPPPTIQELTVDEAQPAYLFRYGTREELSGKKENQPSRPISLTGDKSTVQVPAGTDLTITARIDKGLRSADGVRLLPAKGNAVPNVPVEQADDHTFRVRLSNLHTPLEFFFEFTDTDNVSGKRRIEVRPTLDNPPEVEVQVEVMRKVKDAYWVTPQAKVPFSGKVRDDRGLVRLEYVHTHEMVVESKIEPAAKVGLAVGMTGTGAGGVWPGLAGQGLLGLLVHPTRTEDAKEAVRTPLASFDKKMRELLDGPRGGLLRDFEIDPDLEFFDVGKLSLKVTDEKAEQPKYRMRLWVAATDNNVETGPGVGLSKEKFSFLIVSENELLAEIAKEEEGLHLKLEEAVNRLKDGKIKLAKVAQDLPEAKPNEFSPLIRRSEEVEEAVGKSWDSSREVLNDYRRILKELKANLVQTGMINKVNDKICEPLDAAINTDFIGTDDALKEFHRKLDGAAADAKTLEVAQQRLQALIARLEDVLGAMGDVTTLNKLITALIQIEKSEREEYNRLQKLLKKQEEELLGPIDAPKPKENK